MSASWILVPCLTVLRTEFDLLSPGRDTSSDGSIGDPRHAASSSDHNPDETGNTPYEDSDSINEVHAIDVTANLRKSGVSMQGCVQTIVRRHREGQDARLQNVIFNGRIWSRSWGWESKTYTGENPHTKHAHFSARYVDYLEADTRSWGLLYVPQKEWDLKSVDHYGVPYLKYGMRDIDYAGYNSIERVQRILGVKDDGWYGDETAEAVRRWYPSTNGKEITKTMYCNFMGIAWLG